MSFDDMESALLKLLNAAFFGAGRRNSDDEGAA